MSRGVTLGQLITDLRSEVGHSLSPAMGKNTRDVLINILQRNQRRLWEDYAWPFLRVEKDVAMAEGQRYYDLPTGLTFERIEKVEFRYGNRWQPVSYGISGDHLNAHDSDNDKRSWPVERYSAAESQIEVWPIPSQGGDSTTKDGVIRFTGIKGLSSFISDADTADLDDQLIILFSAYDILLRQSQKDADAKLGQANAHYMRLKGRLSKGDVFIMSGGPQTYGFTPRGAKPIPL